MMVFLFQETELVQIAQKIEFEKKRRVELQKSQDQLYNKKQKNIESLEEVGEEKVKGIAFHG